MNARIHGKAARIAGLALCMRVARIARRLTLARIPRRVRRIRLSILCIGGASMLAVGCRIGMMGKDPDDRARPAAMSSGAAVQSDSVARGHELFLLNCAHCHGTDARGTEEAPSLRELHRSDARIASVITNGIKGEMPRFGQRFQDEQVQLLVQFLRSVQIKAAARADLRLINE